MRDTVINIILSVHREGGGGRGREDRKGKKDGRRGKEGERRTNNTTLKFISSIEALAKL